MANHGDLDKNPGRATRSTRAPKKEGQGTAGNYEMRKNSDLKWQMEKINPPNLREVERSSTGIIFICSTGVTTEPRAPSESL